MMTTSQKKTPELPLWGFQMCTYKTTASFAYTHYSICTKQSQVYADNVYVYPESQAVFNWRTEIRYMIVL